MTARRLRISKWSSGNSCTRITLLVNRVYKLNAYYSRPRCCCCHDFFFLLLGGVPGIAPQQNCYFSCFFQETFRKIVSLMFALVALMRWLYFHCFWSQELIYRREYYVEKSLLLIASPACNDIVVILLRINTRVLKCNRAYNIIYINVNSAIVWSIKRGIEWNGHKRGQGELRMQYFEQWQKGNQEAKDIKAYKRYYRNL